MTKIFGKPFRVSQWRSQEIKSSQTYHPDFGKGLVAFEKVFGDRVVSQQIVYCGEMENTSAKIKLLNYKNIKY
ncbi:hypothetical protein FACS1894156_3130 [Bacteroidia bacterium]|nr:hypothetical protein FACS1894156_3130 [Bacteroidia bacterium]